LINVIIIILKIIPRAMFLIALIYSAKNYSITRYASGMWLLLTLVMAVAFVLTLIRTFKEFYWFDELEIAKICLIPVVITLLPAASMEIKRSILRPL